MQITRYSIIGGVILAAMAGSASAGNPDSFAMKAADNAAAAILDPAYVTPAWTWMTLSVSTGLPSPEPYYLHCTERPNKLIVFAHSWSADYTQVAMALSAAGTLVNVCIIAPNFGGPNNTPNALASPDALIR